MKKYLPLLLVEGYLVTTLLVYFFGPVQFRGHNTDIFFQLIFLYHLMFILGYYIATRTYQYNGRKLNKKFSEGFFYISLFFAVFSTLISYKNVMQASSIIPFDIVADVLRGANEPGLVYSEHMGNASGVSNGRALNILSMFFAFSKLFFIFFFIYFWRDLSLFKRLLALAYSLLFVSLGVASGTNSVIFIFFIFFAFSLLAIYYIRNPKYPLKMLLFIGSIFLIPVGFFGYIMSRRGGGFDYFSSVSPIGDISVTVATPNLDNVIDFYYYAFVWLNYYLVQGYYGFSLILNLDLNWTFGFGNSAFLQRQLLVLTGVDVSEATFQARISEYWDANAQWHSFYGQFANDFGLVGVAFFMFVLGYFLSKVWSSILYQNSFYGVALLPIFMLMFIFFPANNQVFGYIDTFSYFIFISIFWFFEDKKIRLR